MLYLSKLKEFADDNFDFDENDRKFSKRGETLWEKEKLVVTSNFSFSQCFQKTCTADIKKTRDCLRKGKRWGKLLIQVTLRGLRRLT